MHGTKRLFAAGMAAMVVAAGAAAEDKVLHVYNWSDYIAEDTIAKFEAATGVKVTYDVYDSNEVLETKLLAGKSGYDVVVPSGSFLERQIKAGIFAKVDKAALKNYGNLDPDIMARVAVHDPGNAHSVPYMWGTTGIGYNVKMVKQRLGELPVDSWDLIFNPDVVSKLGDCGVTLLDAPAEVFEIALNYLGLDPFSASRDDYKRAEALLMKARPHIKYFHSSKNIDDLANGEICVAMGWSGDMFIAMDQAAEGVEIGYVIPKEGTVIWFDLMAIPADAPHPGNAHKFIDFILKPEVAAAITNYVFYANPNKASMPLVAAEILADPNIYPPDAVRQRLFADKMVTPKVDRLRTRTWTRVKTGQ